VRIVGAPRARGDGTLDAVECDLDRARPGRAARPPPRARARAAAIWSPMVNTGLSEVIGSWNTMAMRAPRTRRMASASVAEEVVAVEQDMAAGGDAAGRGHQPP